MAQSAQPDDTPFVQTFLDLRVPQKFFTFAELKLLRSGSAKDSKPVGGYLVPYLARFAIHKGFANSCAPLCETSYSDAHVKHLRELGDATSSLCKRLQAFSKAAARIAGLQGKRILVCWHVL